MLGIPMLWLGSALLAVIGGICLSVAGLPAAAASLFGAALPMGLAGGVSLLSGLMLCDWRRRARPDRARADKALARHRTAGVGDKWP